MEAPMVRRTDARSLEVRVSFELTRLGPQCLIDAYSRLVPIRREAPRKVKHDRPRPAAMAASRRGGDHGG